MDQSMLNNPPESLQPKGSSSERERIVAAFAGWLDRALEDEPQPGLSATLLAALENGDQLPPLANLEGGCDLYGLWSAMTALTQEVRLQGRQFKLLQETLQQTALRQVEQDAAAAEESASARSSQQQIDVLLDMRERLERTIATARAAAAELSAAHPPFIARWFGGAGKTVRMARELADSLVAGNNLTLGQLDESLRNLGVSRMACLNRHFDPRTMTAVAVELTDAAPEGTVVEIFRNGYEWNGEVYRTAQVKVARKREGAER
jgi:molecular chaperone GrpE